MRPKHPGSASGSTKTPPRLGSRRSRLVGPRPDLFGCCSGDAAWLLRATRVGARGTRTRRSAASRPRAAIAAGHCDRGCAMMSPVVAGFPPSAAPPSARVPTLEVMSGLHRGVTVPLERRRYCVGSALMADIALRDAGVASEHVEIDVGRRRIHLEAIGADVGLRTGRLPMGTAATCGCRSIWCWDRLSFACSRRAASPSRPRRGACRGGCGSRPGLASWRWWDCVSLAER